MEQWEVDLVRLIAAHKDDRPLQVFTLATEVIEAVERVVERRHQMSYRAGYRAGHSAASSRKRKAVEFGE
jgi:hypothetical protein